MNHLSDLDLLRAAVADDPESPDLRVRLAIALLDAAMPDEALVHCVEALKRRPDDLDAIEVAADAADATHNKDLAARYHHIWHALLHDNGTRLLPGGRHPSEDDEEQDGKSEADERVVPLRVLEGGGEGDLEHPRIKLNDVRGLTRIKEHLAVDIAAWQQHEGSPSSQSAPHDGLLLYGPRHCGKAFIARVIAGELDAAFLQVQVPELLAHWKTWGERRLRESFRLALRSSPCVVHLDLLDIDEDSEIAPASREGLVAEVALQLDHLATERSGVVVVASATFPWNVDAALVRPGRLGRVCLVLPPDRVAREAILLDNLAGRQLAEAADIEWLADKTDGYSAEDLRKICDKAVQLAGPEAEAISADHVRHAREAVRSSSAVWLDAAAHRALINEHSGLYDDLLTYLRTRQRPQH